MRYDDLKENIESKSIRNPLKESYWKDHITSAPRKNHMKGLMQQYKSKTKSWYLVQGFNKNISSSWKKMFPPDYA